MNQSPRLPRTILTALLSTLCLLGATACSADDSAAARPHSDATTSAQTSAATPDSPEPLHYVAFGASWQYGAHCGFCTTFVTYYARLIEETKGFPVEFDNRSTNGGGTKDFLATLQDDQAARDSVAAADIVLIGGGINDVDETKVLEKVVDGSCGGPRNDRCLYAMRAHWRNGFEAILDEVDQLTGTRPVAVRLVGDQNVFLSDPTIIADYGLPDDFDRAGGELLTRLQADVMAQVAKRHHAKFVDVWQIFNGPKHDEPWDENTDEAHRAVAQAILDTGLDPLDVE
jgi:hypothetical protein